MMQMHVVRDVKLKQRQSLENVCEMYDLSLTAEHTLCIIYNYAHDIDTRRHTYMQINDKHVCMLTINIRVVPKQRDRKILDVPFCHRKICTVYQVFNNSFTCPWGGGGAIHIYSR